MAAPERAATATNFPAELRRMEAEVSGDPLPDTRDLCDIAGLVAQIALTMTWVAKGLGDAHADGTDQHRAKETALGTLRQAHADLGGLIADFAEMRVA